MRITVLLADSVAGRLQLEKSLLERESLTSKS
jgi:hypothetical protein